MSEYYKPRMFEVNEAIKALACEGIDASVETGCGESTILLSRFSRNHTVFCLDDRERNEKSSVRYVERSPLVIRDRLHWVFGSSQLTLPHYDAHQPYDLVVIDGPHGYPFPEVEYSYLFPHLKTGGLLIVGHVNIPTIGRLADFIAEDEMFKLIDLVEGTAIFRRTATPAFNLIGGDWSLQAYNRRRVSPARSTFLADRKVVETISRLGLDDRMHRGLPLHRTVVLNLGKVLQHPHPGLSGLAARLDPLAEGESSAKWQKLFTEVDTEVSTFDELLIDGLRTVLIAVDAPIAALDLFFRFRLVQLLGGLRGPDATLLVVIPPGDAVAAPGGFHRRFHESWPFARTLFVCPEAASAALYTAQLGVSVHAVQEDEIVRLARALADGKVIDHSFLYSSPLVGQSVAVQVQPMWGRCGSSTAFENELEALVEAGHFVIHTFVPDATASAPDDALLTRYDQCRRETSAHVGAHAACFVSRSSEPARISYIGDDASREFHAEVLARAALTTSDRLAAAAMRLAQVVIVNHVTNVPLSIGLCPAARIVLDMHDYFCRGAYARSRLSAAHKSFASIGSLRRMLRTEVALWQLADVCTAVSHSELRRVRRWQNASTIVLPRPYVERVQMPTREAAEYDALVVSDQHPFNIDSLRWFLERVWRPYLLPRGMRLAVAGRAVHHIDTASRRYRGVAFLGFVDDLEALRGRCLMTVAPDLTGTGIAIKALTVLAAGHPLVATPAAVRGYDPDIVARLPAHAKPEDLAEDLVTLVRSADARAERIAIGDAVFRDLTSQSFVGVLSQATAIQRPPNASKDAVTICLSEATDWLVRSRLSAERARLEELRSNLAPRRPAAARHRAARHGA